MSRVVPVCSHCGGPLTRPLPPDLLDPRLGAGDRVMRCADCGRADRVDAVERWGSADE